jgi:predicted metal-dependent phosphoesterase TrpH
MGNGPARSISPFQTLINHLFQLKAYRAELHLHTVLSPCASVEMIPPLIIQEAESKEINLIAVSDHNAIANIASVMRAAQGSSVTVLPAIELQTREEIHSLCLFDSLDQIEAFYKRILPSFPDIRNNVEYFWRTVHRGRKRRFSGS